MKEFEITIKYDEEQNEVHIEDYHYNSCTYCNIKTIYEIDDCVRDFIKSYYEGK